MAPGDPDAPFLIAMAGVILLLSILLVAQWYRSRRTRRAVAAVETALGALTHAARVPLHEIPGRLTAIMEDVALLLARLEEKPPAPVPVARPPERVLLDAALEAVAAAAATSRSLSADALAAHFDMVDQLDAAAKALTAVRDGDDPAAALANALRTGQLNHLLTMGLVLQAYFRDDSLYAPLRTHYAAAGAVVEALLASSGIVVDLPAPGFVPRSRRESQADFADRRRLRDIKPIRDQVRALARKLEDGDLLIVDCPAPGWRDADVRHPPTLIAYNRADWTS
jgi:hypothetical protein